MRAAGTAGTAGRGPDAGTAGGTAGSAGRGVVAGLGVDAGAEGSR